MEVSEMDISSFIIYVYCIVDDFLKGKRLRQRGPQPTLSDSEILTMENRGRISGTRHRSEHQPLLSAALPQLVSGIEADSSHDFRPPGSQPVGCQTGVVGAVARAYRCHRRAGETAFGKDEVARQTFLGLHANVCINWPRVITNFRLKLANVHDLAVAEVLFAGIQAWVLGDRNTGAPI
jgi:hypothetical protein